MTSSFGAIDIFGGANSIGGTNLFSVDKSPLNVISMGTGALDTIEQAMENMIETAIADIPEFAGIIMDFLEQLPISLLNDGLAFFGLPTIPEGLGATAIGQLLSPQGLIDTFISFLSGGLITTGDLTQLSSLLDNIPLIGPLVQAITGGSSILGLSGLGSWFTDLMAILGNPVGLGSGINIGNWATLFINNVLSPTGLLSTAISVADDIIGLFTNAIPGLSGMAGLGSIFTDLTGLLGNPTGLGSGSPGLPGLDGIPLLGPLAGAITGALGSGGNTLAALTAALEAIPQGNVVGLAAALANAGVSFADLVLGLFGLSGGTQSLFNTLGGNLMSMLGSPNLNPTGTFDPIAMGEQMLTNVLSPAGALTNLTTIPAHLFGFLMPGGPTNIAPPFTAESVSPGGFWNWSGSLGAWQTTADGTLRQLISVPYQVPAGQPITVGISSQWASLAAAAGNAITVGANFYNGSTSTATLISSQTAQAIASPAANQATWQALSGTLNTPTGASFMRLVMSVTQNVTGGTVSFQTPVVQLQQLLDASLLGNIGNIPQLLSTSIAGIQGLTDQLTSWGHMIDGLGTSFTQGSGTQSGLPFSGLFDLAEQIASQATNALNLATDHEGILGNVSTFPLTNGLDPTAQATFDLQALPHGATLPTTTVTTNNAIGAVINMPKDATKGFVEFLGSMAASSSGVYVNLYNFNTSTGVRTLLWGSTDIGSLIPTTTNWVRVMIPGTSQPTVAPGQQIHAEIVNQSANTLTVAMRQNPSPNKTISGVILQNTGITRSAATASPSSIVDGSFAYQGITPWISLGVATVPPNYWAPIKVKFTTPAGNGQGAGYSAMGAQANYTTSYTLPSQFRSGVDFVDYVIAPAGGGGDSGTGGSGGSAGNSTVTIDGVTHNAAGTVGANNGGVFDSGAGLSVGKGLGNYTFNGQVYQAGGDVAAQNWGSIPGGGGGGGAQFVGFKTAYGEGASQGTWVAGTTQPTNMTISMSLGYGGRGQSNYSAGNGADAAVWLYIYQNSAA